MRDLKFRVWDEKAQVMSFPFYNTDMSDDGFCVADGALWMQYTGFEDKNFTEVFEGDIVEVNNKNAGVETFVVEFDKGAWRFIGNHKNFTLWSSSDEIEVIGNIMEHPELARTVR